MEFNPQPTIKPSSTPAIVAAVIVLAIYNGAFIYCSGLTAQEASVVGHNVGIATDLTLCSPNFTTLALTQTIFILAVSGLSVLGIFAAFFELYTYKRKFGDFGKLFAITAALPIFLLLPWLTGDIFMLKKFDFGQACLQSTAINLYSPFIGILIGFAQAWLVLLLPYIIIKIVRSGKKPGDLPDDPVQREAALKLKANFETWRSRSAVRYKRSMVLALGTLLMALSLPVAGWLGISLLRAYHNLTWEPVQVTLIDVAGTCTMQSKPKGGEWKTLFEYDCSSQANPNPAELRKRNKLDGTQYRLVSKPSIKMELIQKDGSKKIIVGRRDVFMPVPLPMGTQITILRDPDNHGRIDRVFAARDQIQIATRAGVLLFLVMIAFFAFIRPALRMGTPIRIKPVPTLSR